MSPRLNRRKPPRRSRGRDSSIVIPPSPHHRAAVGTVWTSGASSAAYSTNRGCLDESFRVDPPQRLTASTSPTGSASPPAAGSTAGIGRHATGRGGSRDLASDTHHPGGRFFRRRGRMGDGQGPLSAGSYATSSAAEGERLGSRT